MDAEYAEHLVAIRNSATTFGDQMVKVRPPAFGRFAAHCPGVR